MNTPTEEQRLQRIIQFHHPERMWPPLTDEQHARFLGTDLQTYRRIHTQLVDGVWQAAQELLADAAFAAQVDALPFAPGSTVLGLGDSITEDTQSWFELLKTAVAIRRPQDEINFVNEGVSGNCTADVMRRITPVMAHRPDWVLCLLGTNDASLFGRMPVKTLIVPNETARNLVAIRRAGVVEAAESGVNCRWLWITPPPCVEPQVRDDWFLAPIPVFYLNRDLAAVADIVRRQQDPVADSWPAFCPDPAAQQVRPRPEFFLPDGLHPSLEGQKAILRAVVSRLVSD
jgi:lysophospholipase L1-like esterase